MTESDSGTIRVSPAVLRTIASMTAKAVPGVVAMRGEPSAGLVRLLGPERSHRGAKVRLHGDELSIDLYIVVEAGADIRRVAYQVQQNVAEAISALVGLAVREVNVYVHDIR